MWRFGAGLLAVPVMWAVSHCGTGVTGQIDLMGMLGLQLNIHVLDRSSMLWAR